FLLKAVKIVRLRRDDVRVPCESGDNPGNGTPVENLVTVDRRIDQLQALRSDQGEPFSHRDVEGRLRRDVGAKFDHDFVANEPILVCWDNRSAALPSARRLACDSRRGLRRRRNSPLRPEGGAPPPPPPPPPPAPP